ncbi:alpha/beta-hydrolase superfamily protein [Medicago truncatula]|uniref:Alpha/beta-hydrolase superfamily protein n=1 Tax=Medicago truncatula TaxID=3880 RepID=G7K047_MEDTR|nr:alpha/beta-hydrolase superfamily protein [Medicago truncatula]
MIRLQNIYEQLVELFLSSLVILFYGFYIFGTDVAQDLSNSLGELENDDVVKENEVNHAPKDDMTPIYCDVHDSQLIETKTKHHRALVPDLGVTTTSIYDSQKNKNLKDGQVDYGEENRTTFGNLQFGQIYESGWQIFMYYKFVEDDHIAFLWIGREKEDRLIQYMIYDSIFERCTKLVFKKKFGTVLDEA